MSKNTIRRHHLKRLKNNRQWDLTVTNLTTTERVFCHKYLARHVATPKPCSCWLCGNPRKFYGNGKAAKTFQEQKAINDTIFQLSASLSVA